MAKTRKKPTDSAKKESAVVTTKKVDVEKKAKNSLRERNRKAAESKDKPKRTRKAATAARKPVDKAASLLTAEHHVLPKGEQKGFFTKSRSVAPSYVKDSLLELRNVTWPGRKETWRLVFAVFVFALAMGSFIAILDYGLEKVMREVIL